MMMVMTMMTQIVMMVMMTRMSTAKMILLTMEEGPRIVGGGGLWIGFSPVLGWLGMAWRDFCSVCTLRCSGE